MASNTYVPVEGYSLDPVYGCYGPFTAWYLQVLWEQNSHFIKSFLNIRRQAIEAKFWLQANYMYKQIP